MYSVRYSVKPLLQKWASVLAFCVLVSGLLSACSTTEVSDSGPSGYVDVSKVKDAVPTNEPHSRMGNPASYVVRGQRYYVLDSSENFTERGRASWYGNKFHGNKTSNGEVYDMYQMTAAHKRLPLPTYVKVTNLENNRHVIVRVNDRGPFHKGRIIDLSYVAALKLGITTTGTAPVKVEALSKGSNTHTNNWENPKKDHKSSQKVSIVVQVGAFSTRASAQRLRNELLKLYKTKVSISKLYRDGSILYRVRLGPYDNLRSAKYWNNRLNSSSFGPASLVYLE